MADWTAGYVADIGYTFGYYNELNPLWSELALLEAGVDCPDFSAACDLGFGQGVSLTMHAAASDVLWCGNDFNPSQAGFAQSMAKASGSNSIISDESFEDFCNRDDLPDFDFIALHGIWSWISDANRKIIVDFLSRKLKVGGVLYTGYNTNPGWASMVPMRNLMNEYSELMQPAAQHRDSKIGDTLGYIDRLLELNPKYVTDNPQVASRLKKMKAHQHSYLAHEYFNQDWEPMSFKDMHGWLSEAKLSFVCSASYLEHIDVINVNEKQLAFLNEIPDPVFREQVRDMLINQQFRKDYWVKGPRKLSTLDKIAALRARRVVLVKHRDDIELNVTGALSKADLTAEIYHPILDCLGDHEAKSLAEIEAEVAPKGLSLAQLLQSLFILMGKGALQPARDEASIRGANEGCAKMNAHVIESARGNDQVAYLASPVTGGAIPLERFKQLSLMAYQNGISQPDQIAKFVWQILASQGSKINKQGKTLQTEQENLAELLELTTEFIQKDLPRLKALLITPK